MTVEPLNNRWGLERIVVRSVSVPYAVGDAIPGRGAFANWLVLWRDPTTLMIATTDRPNDCYTAHVYQHRHHGSRHEFILTDPKWDDPTGPALPETPPVEQTGAKPRPASAK